MRRHPFHLLVLIGLLALGRLGAADQAPLLTEGDLAAAPDWQVLYLPADRDAAVQLLHGYNAASVLQAETVPHERQLLSLSILLEHGADGSEASWAGGPAWRLLTSAGRLPYQDIDPATVDALAYDLRHLEGLADRLVLPVPAGIGDVSIIQDHLDSSWKAAGNEAGLRPVAATQRDSISFGDAMSRIGGDSGLAKLGLGNYLMLAIGLLLFYLGIAKGFEPLLLVPIAMGCIFVNAIGADMLVPGTGDSVGAILHVFNQYGIATGIFPLLIFLGVGALTDFGPLLANPWSALLGAAAQFGIFGAFFLAVIIGGPMFGFTLADAGAIAIIGGADGPTSIFVASKLAPDKLGAIAVAAYSYMALVPIIQPPVMRALTNADERKIMMTQARPVSQRAKILFPIVVIVLCVLTLPSAVPLIGMLMFGNLLRECGATERLVKAAQNELINLVTIGLGLAVGTKLSADKFLTGETIGILVLGCIAFVIGTAAGVLFGKLMCRMSGGRINPLIGAAGVSAVPMAARVVHAEGLRENRRNMLLMHAMGPNVAGVIGSAVAAGILLALLGS